MLNYKHVDTLLLNMSLIIYVQLLCKSTLIAICFLCLRTLGISEIVYMLF